MVSRQTHYFSARMDPCSALPLDPSMPTRLVLLGSIPARAGNAIQGREAMSQLLVIWFCRIRWLRSVWGVCLHAGCVHRGSPVWLGSSQHGGTHNRLIMAAYLYDESLPSMRSCVRIKPQPGTVADVPLGKPAAHISCRDALVCWCGGDRPAAEHFTLSAVTPASAIVSRMKWTDKVGPRSPTIDIAKRK